MNTKILDAKTLGFGAVAAILGMGFAMAVSVSADTGGGMGWGSQRGACDPERHETLEAAMEDGDYATWLETMDGRGRITQVVTEENFDTFVDMHEAMEEGDYDRAQELRKELGLGVRPQDGTGFRGEGQGRGMGHGMRGGLNR
jgi:hypothetical protein